jgi:hypothetical protein
MVVYIAHCTDETPLKNILSQKIIRTSLDMDKVSYGQSDIVYFTFFDPNDPIQFYSGEYCIYFRLRHILTKYRYYAVTPYDNYGEIIPGVTRISPRIYKLVQKSNTGKELKHNILSDARISSQAKDALVSRIEDLYAYKLTDNPTLLSIYVHRSFWSEIIIFENVDFSDVPYHIAKEKIN